MEAEDSMQPAGEQARPTIVISGSLAYDYIMSYPGSFQDHIIPGKVYVLSISFLLDSLRRHRGGVAGNIAYNFALLGERPAIVGAGGSDFADYRAACDALGIDTSHVVEVNDVMTGSAFMTADLAGNQIAGFYPGASSRAESVSVGELGRDAIFAFVGATAREVMRLHAQEFGAAKCRMIYDPSQQVVSVSEEELVEGIGHAWGVIGSDYEMAVIEKRTGLSVEQLVERLPFVARTLGHDGSELFVEGNYARIPAAAPVELKDPTGGGDAYRAGIFKGLLLGLPLEVAGRLGSLSATYAVEQHGPQEHWYTPAEFVARFDNAFPDYAGAIKEEWLRSPVERESAVNSLAGAAAGGA
jgi:adenosine kinase